MLVVTVDVRDAQPIAPLAVGSRPLGDEGDSRVERATNPREPHVNLVGDLMRHPAHQIRCRGELESDGLLAAQHVVELILDDEVAVERRGDAADDETAGSEQTPVAEPDVRLTVGPARQAVERDRLEQARAGEVVGDDGGDIRGWLLAGVLPPEGNDRDWLFRLGALRDPELDDRVRGIPEQCREENHDDGDDAPAQCSTPQVRN